MIDALGEGPMCQHFRAAFLWTSFLNIDKGMSIMVRCLLAFSFTELKLLLAHRKLENTPHINLGKGLAQRPAHMPSPPA